ncbi:MAG: DegV family protein [Clostridia bacterium]|nr:DegV family protein [Clostridia bacterium]
MSEMKKKTVITADSTCDLGPALLAAHGIRIVPLYVTVGGKTYADGVNITVPELFDSANKMGELPRTSAPSPEDFHAVFADAQNEGEEVVHISISSELSSSYANACLCAAEMEHVYVVDSRNLSTGIGLLVLEAVRLAEQGLCGTEIAQKITELTGLVEASFVIDKLDYLHKGGRCSATTALSAGLLHIRPTIEVKNGGMLAGRKHQGSLKKCVEKYIVERLRGRTDIDTRTAFITGTCETDELPLFAEQLLKKDGRFETIHITEAGSTIASHCGPNTLGIIFLKNHE